MTTIICTKKDPFGLLKSLNPEIYKITKYLSVYIERDRRITCFYARFLAEQIVITVFNLKKVEMQEDCLRGTLKTNAARQIIKPEIITKIERIARIGNKAAHQLEKPTALSTLNCLRDLLDVVRWFASSFYNIKIDNTMSSQVFKFDDKKDSHSSAIELSKIGGIVDEFINLRSKKNSRIIYQKSIHNFCNVIYPGLSTETAIKHLLNADESSALKLLYDYRQLLLEDASISNTTICQKVSVINSFLHHAYSRGYCKYQVSISLVPRPQSTTPSIDKLDWMASIDKLDRSKPKGARDYCILQLLTQEKIDRQDISKIELKNFNGSQLSIPVEGSPRNKIVTLSPATKQSVESWLKLRPQIGNAYLFTRLSNNLQNLNTPLSERGIYQVVQAIGEAANLDYRLNIRSISASMKS